MRNTHFIPNQPLPTYNPFKWKEKPKHKTGTLIWDSRANGTFRGSIRNQFTGPNRNNIV